MRVLLVALLACQLFLRGAAGPHCHVSDGRSQPADHASRPHAHLVGHRHPHHGAHDHHASSHQHPRGEPESTETTTRKVPFSSEHDDDAIYVGHEPFVVPLQPVQISESLQAGWVLVAAAAWHPAVLPQRVIPRAAGPPADNASDIFDILPHRLRI